jgi:hypothetical protein
MAVQSTTTNVLIAIADATPSDAGFALSSKKVLQYAGASNVWIKLRAGSVAAGRGGAVRYTWLNQVLIPATGSFRIGQGSLGPATITGP